MDIDVEKLAKISSKSLENFECTQQFYSDRMHEIIGAMQIMIYVLDKQGASDTEFFKALHASGGVLLNAWDNVQFKEPLNENASNDNNII
jgi:hypothetical protein